jgi:hypothetical protein
VQKSVTWEPDDAALRVAEMVEEEKPVEIAVAVEIAPEPSFVGYRRRWGVEDYWEI